MWFHWLALSIVLVLAHSSYCIKSENSSSTVILVHVIFRHGIRTPSFFYPTDPHANKTFYPHGRGILTNRGKRMMYKLGQTLRRRYSRLLDEYYDIDKMTVRTAKSSRTKMSAQLVLAGLWPPVKLQRWNEDLNWQPIPIDSADIDEDDVLNSNECLVKSELVKNMDFNTTENNFFKSYQHYIEYLQLHSGLKISTPIDALALYVTLVSEQEYGLVLPVWTDAVFPEPLQDMAAEVYEYQNSNPTIAAIQSGFLVKKILNDTYNKINQIEESRNRVMHLYSSEDTIVGGLLNSLKVLKKELPHFGSSVIIEVHQIDGEYFFMIKYTRNPFKPKVWVLEIPNCGTGGLCPVHKFAELYNHLLPNLNYKDICSTEYHLQN